jgi:glutamate-5-semialdehyde dehydrogenase
MKNLMYLIGNKARIASKVKVNSNTKNKILVDYIKLIKKNTKIIIRENKKDLKYSEKKKIPKNLVDRLKINSKKINEICIAIKNVVKLKDPINNILKKWKRPNNLIIKQVSIPIGTIGIIFESRPNVASDVASLCFKSGNAVILRGGSEALNSNKILVKLFRKSLKKNKIDPNYVQLIEKRERKYVDFMLSNMSKYIDVIIPRGGKSLVKKVQSKSKIPIIGHLEGICHTYIDKEADLRMSIKVVYNAKLRNTSICGATETILMHNKIVKKFCNPILNKLEINNCKIIGDKYLKKIYKGNIYLAKNKDWSTEYLAPIVSVKCVNNLDEAIEHINKYGTMHTDSIITKNNKRADKFLKNVKSSIAIHNASTQFADGGEFGFGGEVGISTNKLPPRGPIGLEQLFSYKYEVSGKGQIRK